MKELRDLITEVIYKNSHDTSSGLEIDFNRIERVIDYLNQLSEVRIDDLVECINGEPPFSRGDQFQVFDIIVTPDAVNVMDQLGQMIDIRNVMYADNRFDDPEQ